jgi:hypothetical protein
MGNPLTYLGQIITYAGKWLTDDNCCCECPADPILSCLDCCTPVCTCPSSDSVDYSSDSPCSDGFNLYGVVGSQLLYPCSNSRTLTLVVTGIGTVSDPYDCASRFFPPGTPSGDCSAANGTFTTSTLYCTNSPEDPSLYAIFPQFTTTGGCNADAPGFPQDTFSGSCVQSWVVKLWCDSDTEQLIATLLTGQSAVSGSAGSGIADGVCQVCAGLVAQLEMTPNGCNVLNNTLSYVSSDFETPNHDLCDVSGASATLSIL